MFFIVVLEKDMLFVCGKEKVSVLWLYGIFAAHISIFATKVHGLKMTAQTHY
jgi:hypothetical protein